MNERVTFACAWCQRVRTESGTWDAAAEHDLNCAGVTHGICPECLERETGGPYVLALPLPVAAG